MGRRIAGFIAALVATSACSYLDMPKIRTTGHVRDERVAATCTPSETLPTIDRTASTLGALSIVFGLGVSFLIVVDGEGSALFDSGVLGAAMLGVFGGGGLIVHIPYEASARHGYRSARRCREERAKCRASDPGCLRPAPIDHSDEIAADLRARCRIERRGDFWFAKVSVFSLASKPRSVALTVTVNAVTGEQRQFPLDVALAPNGHDEREVPSFEQGIELATCTLSIAVP